MTIDRAAWATVAPSADYYDIHGNDLGTNSTTADTNGKRWMFTDRFEGTNWVSAAYPSAYLTPLPDYPLVQPSSGFVLPVNTYGSNSFAANHEITSYILTSNTNGYIGLGGSFRATSDFNKPGSSVWWEHLALAQDPAARSRGCPICSSHEPSKRDILAVAFPQLAKEWMAKEDGCSGSIAYTTYATSGKLAQWQCPAFAEHQYKTKVSARTDSSAPQGCPQCYAARQPT